MKKIKAVIIAVLILGVLGGLTYSLYITFKSGAASAGTVTCTEGGCIWTAHIHSFIPISICGKDYRLPIETAPLIGPHTHEEKNIAHWHDKLPYDKDLKAITNTEPITLKAFFEEIEVPFSATRIADKNNGDLCDDGLQGTVSVFINGTLDADPASYVWRDRDIIQIYFHTNSLEELTNEVNANPVRFPKLGRG